MASQEMRLKKAHVALLNYTDTALYSGVILMGKSSVEDKDITAYTDGVNKKYGRKFIEGLTDQELCGLVMHENLHVAFKHIQRFTKEFKAEPHLVNVAADYVVNDVIKQLNPNIVKLPDDALYDAKFHNWSVREVYNYLKQKQKEQQDKKSKGESTGSGLNGNGQPDVSDMKTLDDHDFENAQTMSPEQVAEQASKIDNAIRQGSLLAGRLGAKIPRTIQDLLTPKVNWREVLREFISSATRGSDEYTWRRFNKRLMVNDIYMPSIENESMGELIVAIDTSGSIGSVELTEFATELVTICEVSSPSKVRVLWWDTEVHSMQVFEPSQYNAIASLLKPEGGGGTHVSSVSEYINKHKIQTEAVIVFTDGYVEDDIKWNITSPTLWLITQRSNFPTTYGKVIRKED